MARIHAFKVWPPFFAALAAGDKQFEVRRDDRGGFSVGDRLWLREWDQVSARYSGRSLRAVVRYVLTGGQFGIEPGFVVMGLGAIETETHTTAIGPATGAEHDQLLMDGAQ